MPRFFFDYYEDGEVFMDTEGLDLPNVADANREAAQIAAEIARDHLTDHPSKTFVEVRGRDQAGETICAKSIGIHVDGEQLGDAFYGARAVPLGAIRRR